MLNNSRKNYEEVFAGIGVGLTVSSALAGIVGGGMMGYKYIFEKYPVYSNLDTYVNTVDTVLNHFVHGLVGFPLVYPFLGVGTVVGLGAGMVVASPFFALSCYEYKRKKGKKTSKLEKKCRDNGKN